MSTDNSKIRHGERALKILGLSPVVGAPLPDARLVTLGSGGLKDVAIKDLRGKVLLLSVVPSIDTSTCHAQTKQLNQALRDFGDTVQAYTVSLDLPFAQERWAKTECCLNMGMLSDYKYREFGRAFGAFIEDLALLTRAVFISDSAGNLRYLQFVENISDEPDYEPILRMLGQLS